MSKDVFDTSKAKSSGFGNGNTVANAAGKSMDMSAPKKIKSSGKAAKGLADGGHTFTSASKSIGNAAGATAEAASGTLKNIAESGGTFIATGIGGTGSKLLEGAGKGFSPTGEGVSKVVGSTADGIVALGRGSVSMAGDAMEVTTNKLPQFTRSLAQSAGTVIASPIIAATEIVHAGREFLGAFTRKPHVRTEVVNHAERTLGGDLKQLGHAIAGAGEDVAKKVIEPALEVVAHNPKTALFAGSGSVALGATAYAHAHMQSFANTENTKRKFASVLNPAEQAKT
jgi:hypothetical protein